MIETEKGWKHEGIESRRKLQCLYKDNAQRILPRHKIHGFIWHHGEKIHENHSQKQSHLPTSPLWITHASIFFSRKCVRSHARMRAQAHICGNEA